MSSSITNLLIFLLTGSAAVSGHMILSSPPALRYKDNPYAGQNIDYDLMAPISSLAEIPCKGSLSLLGTSQATPVATWTAGQSYQMTISGGATHLGGSCQAAVSVDRGKSFHVIKSFIGSCPTPDAKDSSFSFKLPSDTPATDEGIFAWHWSNKVGNREHFSNCAVVKIQGGSGSESTPFGQRPAPFLANIGNGCATLPGVNVEYPDPGPDVERNGDAVPPTGNCGAAQSYPGSGGGGGGSGSSGPGTGSSGGSGGSGSSGDSGTSGPGTYVPGNNWPAGFNGAESSHTVSVWAAVVGAILTYTVFIRLTRATSRGQRIE